MSIFHIVTKDEWAKYVGQNKLKPASLASEGFIHCSTSQQVPKTLERFFAQEPDVFVLELDEKIIADNLVFEDTLGHSERFPHLHAPLPRRAILRAFEAHHFPENPTTLLDDWQSVTELIKQVAVVPSFSSFEERLFPILASYINDVDLDCTRVAFNNWAIKPKESRPEYWFCAHLDKINHFGEPIPEAIPTEIKDGCLHGLLDDAFGVGMVLWLLKNRHRFSRSFGVLFTEMEESTDLRKRPHLLKHRGNRVKHGMGAQKLARHLLGQENQTKAVITLDTTPLFKGKPGIALYSKHWELTKMQPNIAIKTIHEDWEDRMQERFSGLVLANNTNDYLHFGQLFAERNFMAVSMALEPSIGNYHSAEEYIHLTDVAKIQQGLMELLQA